MAALLHTAAMVTLAPVLIAQGIRLRQTALVLPEPPGPRAGTAGSGPPLRVLIAGDSAAAGVGADTQADGLSGQLVAQLAPHRTVTWRLEARTGATTRDTRDHLATLPETPFDIVVTSLGVNDLTRNVPLAKWLDRQARLHDLLRTRFGASRIIVSGMPPMGHFPLLPNPLRWVLGAQALRFDDHLARLCADHADCTHLRFDMPFDPAMMARDGFHPGPLAYTEWARMIRAAIGPAQS